MNTSIQTLLELCDNYIGEAVQHLTLCNQQNETEMDETGMFLEVRFWFPLISDDECRLVCAWRVACDGIEKIRCIKDDCMKNDCMKKLEPTRLALEGAVCSSPFYTAMTPFQKSRMDFWGVRED